MELLKIPAAVRFLSMEPLFGLVEIKDYLRGWLNDGSATCASCGYPACCRGRCDNAGIHWVIVGGESGPHARPMHPDWVRSIRDQSVAASVPFFFEQWGEWGPYDNVRHGMQEDVAKLEVGGKALRFLDGQDVAVRLTPGGIVHRGPTSTPVIRVGKKAAGRLLDGREWNEMPEVKR